METWLVLGGSRVWFGMLERCVYKANSGDRRRAFLRGRIVEAQCLRRVL
jgi:hypothetical protein